MIARWVSTSVTPPIRAPSRTGEKGAVHMDASVSPPRAKSALRCRASGMELLNRLAYLDPPLVWGLVSRGIGLVFLISFASLSWQVLPTAGARGITPIKDSLAAIAAHFPTWKRFLYFPSLLWLNQSDGFLRALPWIGMLAALGIIIGGP